MELAGLDLEKWARSVAGVDLGGHLGLISKFESGNLHLECRACGARWSIVLSRIAGGDGYCSEGATNYYSAKGTLLKRV